MAFITSSVLSLCGIWPQSLSNSIFAAPPALPAINAGKAFGECQTSCRLFLKNCSAYSFFYTNQKYSYVPQKLLMTSNGFFEGPILGHTIQSLILAVWLERDGQEESLSFKIWEKVWTDRDSLLYSFAWKTEFVRWVVLTSNPWVWPGKFYISGP